jgi:1,2-dihydroxy-3-keto-5-methylthiopentene dioxygenase
MATVTIRGAEERVLEEPGAIRAFLAEHGIWYRRFEGGDTLGPEPTDDEILAAYREPIAALMEEGGYRTADVINVVPTIQGLDAMLAKFSREHWHSENEVRFIVGGRGVFHINPGNGRPVFAIEVVAGDMINVPHGTHHWFDLCEERAIRAIRLFEDVSGWTPHYTDSGVDGGFQPLCFGPAYVPPAH